MRGQPGHQPPFGIYRAESSGLAITLPSTEPLHPAFRRALDACSDRERQILLYRLGLTDGSTHTLEEVGERFGVSRERVRQIEVKAIVKMRHPRTEPPETA